MPNYWVRNKKTGKYVAVLSMTISEMETFEKKELKGTDLEIAAGAPGIGYSFHRMKPSDGFKDRLRDIKRSHPGSTIDI
jgi:hypothetical protein